MRALVVYESMFGNTHAVADDIGRGLQSRFDVTVLAVGEATPDVVASADLLVVGGPTHAHGLSTRGTRRAAVDMAMTDPAVETDTGAGAEKGVRDWLRDMPARTGALAATFDTRMRAPAVFTGRASRGLARRLRHHGFRLVARPASFLVDKHNRLLEGEAGRAERWGASLAAAADSSGALAAG